MSFGNLTAAAATTATVAFIGLAVFAGTAVARDQIHIVGSSTVFPFSAKVAEQFGKTTKFKTPVVESTGSGGGLKLFCAGVGVRHPDITNSSRRIKQSEVKRCGKNGVNAITEVKIGFDGIVIANARKGKPMALSLKQIFMALAKDVPIKGKLTKNPYKTWNQINPALPATRIEILGPPPTSGTRDAFVELAMEGGAKAFPSLAFLRKKNKKAFKNAAHTLREDGAFIEAGENDNLIVQKLEANPAALGIFGFSFLDQNRDKVRGNTIGGVTPSFENIADGKYSISRSLYFYVKVAHVGKIPGIKAFIKQFTSAKAWGDTGYLTDKGLIPLSRKGRRKMAKDARAMKPLSIKGN
ncbi:MAG: PstS family phosphate ABC transporter substrate-binding protein [Rhodospirillales bacterium]|jgi:phosphate transport system substrate-binding protein|nr:PstS family phosphate ABC transporter substrate-binding protein [Rhodospirillales bacterium]MBT4005577.1 PstS family phosphate ABC transporter substrate-binding protein [Rhodospirillales bacterium]MBT5076787.1 PstS family phosphate ABC transporter substrate-binding protein [Rhodospirillales bacterium]MBT5112296.1 PstS family phosphate ABC transporter substrate-binding protein [Rhodospirillales bacterium]MBT6187263.1 PstS family phosphate ABC transporter substrate-binding protein [Rhodospiril